MAIRNNLITWSASADDDGPMLHGAWGPLNAHGDNDYPIAREIPTQQTRLTADGRSDGWWIPSPQTRVQSPSDGGEPGQSHRLGFTTGFRPRSVTTQPFTGGIITAPRNLVGRSSYGPVGRDPYTTRLAVGVRAQALAFLPDTAAIARSFVGGRQALTTQMASEGSDGS